MSFFKEIFGTLDECEAQINELEESGRVVHVVYSNPILIERPYQLGSGTGERFPKVKKWHMLLQGGYKR